MNSTNILYCECCKFSCKFESTWIQHVNTSKHKNNGKCIRINKKVNNNTKCDKCDFIAKHKEGLNTHNLLKHSNPQDRKEKFTYYCNNCDFGTHYETIYKTHCETKKHQLITKCLEKKNIEISNLLNSQII